VLREEWPSIILDFLTRPLNLLPQVASKLKIGPMHNSLRTKRKNLKKILVDLRKINEENFTWLREAICELSLLLPFILS